MAGLTVTEKEHWKRRIEARIDKKIEKITASDPDFFERVRRESRKRAIDNLKLDAILAYIEDVEARKDELENQIARARREAVAIVRGVPPDTINQDSYCYSHRQDDEVNKAIEKRAKVLEDDLLAETEMGQRVLELRIEKENLLDTVWLAVSLKQIKDLWTNVGRFLQDEQTRLQQTAIDITPLADN